jgi:hypothetical protein
LTYVRANVDDGRDSMLLKALDSPTFCGPISADFDSESPPS